MQNSLTNTFLKGMNLDTAKEFIGSDQYTYAENIHLSAKNLTEGCITNHKSLYDTGVVVNTDGKILATTSGSIYHEDSVQECYIVLSRLLDGSINLSAYIGVSTIEETPTKVFDLTSFTLDVASDRVKMINVYDNPHQSNVYIASEGSELQVVNLLAKNDPNDTFSIFPETGALPPMEFYNEISGALDNCSVQYAYQLFDVRGKYSALSAISAVIPVGSGALNESSGKGLVLKIPKNVTGFSRIRIYKLKYINAEELPSIYIKDEVKFSGAENDFELYSDINESSLQEITLQEFQNIKRTGFTLNTIEMFNNRLYGGGVKENTFKLNFDARTYRCDLFGNVGIKSLLQNTITVHKMQDIVDGNINIDELADVINPSLLNIADNQYMFYKDKISYGGSGKNIDYCFVTPYVYLSAYNTISVDSGANVNVVSGDIRDNRDTLSVKRGDSFTAPCTIISDDATFNAPQTIPYDDIPYVARNKSFRDTYFNQKFRGYKQGEIYPFGIIFYNKKHLPSLVYWIGDIKMPTFEYKNIAAYVEGNALHDCVGYGLGVRFRVNLSSIPEKDRSEISAFEIVRCNRTVSDRTILCQGIGNRIVGSYGRIIESLPTDTTGYYNPLQVPTGFYDTKHITRVTDTFARNHTENENVITITSPEISIMRENCLSLIGQTTGVMRLGYLTSIVHRENLPETYGNVTLLFKNISQAVTFVDATTNEAKVAGSPVVFTSELSGGSLPTSTFKSGLLVNYAFDGNSATKSLYKFFTPVSTRLLGVLSVDDVTFVDNWDSTISGNDSYVRAIATAGNVRFVNIATSNPPSSISSGTVGWGAGGAKCLLTGSFPENSLVPFEENAEISGNVATVILNEQPVYLDEFAMNPSSSSNSHTGLWATALNRSILATVPLLELTADVGTLYGGFDYRSRSSRSYTSVGCYCPVNGDTVYYVNCFGGDTFVEMYNDMWSANLTLTQPNGDEYYESVNRYIRVKFPVETSINLSRTYGVDLLDEAYLLEYRTLFDPGVVNNYTQTEPLNAYNSAYTTHPTNLIHVAPNIYEYPSELQLYRIVVSGVKNFGEVEDGLQDFNTLDYLDVNGRYGQITNLVTHLGNLYYFLPRCFGRVNSQQRSLIQDASGVELLLGTGAVLQSFSELSTSCGSNVINDPSILSTDAGLYWFDSTTKELILYDGSRLGGLANAKNVKTHFKNITSVIHTGKNRQLNEILFKAENENRAIVYDENIGQFVTYYTDNLQHFALLQLCTVALDDKKLMKLSDAGNTAIDHKSIISVCANSKPLLSKVFDTVMITDTFAPNSTDYGESLEFSGKLICNTTRLGDAVGTQLITQLEGVYYFAIGRDSNKERMRDRVMTITLQPTCNFNISSLQTIFRYSRI